jgi:hypothetical protein
MKFNRITLLGYFIALYISLNAEHYHIFWKSIIAIFILGIYHYKFYLPQAIKHHNAKDFVDLITKVKNKLIIKIKIFDKSNYIISILILNLLFNITIYLMAQQDKDSRYRYNHFIFPENKQSFIDIYDSSEMFLLGIVPLVIYVMIKKLMIKP